MFSDVSHGQVVNRCLLQGTAQVAIGSRFILGAVMGMGEHKLLVANTQRSQRSQWNAMEFNGF